jgi:hypothetical protein
MSTNNGDGPGIDKTLAHAWGDVHRAAWLVAYRRPGGQQALTEAVEGLLQQWAARLGLDSLGRDPEEAAADAAKEATIWGPDEAPDEDEPAEPDEAA